MGTDSAQSSPAIRRGPVSASGKTVQQRIEALVAQKKLFERELASWQNPHVPNRKAGKTANPPRTPRSGGTGVSLAQTQGQGASVASLTLPAMSPKQSTLPLTPRTPRAGTSAVVASPRQPPRSVDGPQIGSRKKSKPSVMVRLEASRDALTAHMLDAAAELQEHEEGREVLHSLRAFLLRVNETLRTHKLQLSLPDTFRRARKELTRFKEQLIKHHQHTIPSLVELDAMYKDRVEPAHSLFLGESNEFHTLDDVQRYLREFDAAASFIAAAGGVASPRMVVTALISVLNREAAVVMPEKPPLLDQLHVDDLLFGTEFAVSEFPVSHSPISVPANATVGDVYKVLGSSHISCVPVYDNERDIYLGLIDLLDLSTFLHRAQPKAEKAGHDVGLAKTLGQASRLSHQPVADLMNASGRNPVVRASVRDPVRSIYDKLASGVHRVLAFNENKLVNVISQSSIVQYIGSHASLLGDRLEKITLEGLGTRDVVSVGVQTSARDALRILAENHLAAVPILSGAGTLVSTFSASDLCYLGQRNFVDSLDVPVLEFISNIRQAATGPDRSPIIVVRESNTLANLVDQLTATRVHRMWILDHSEKVVAVMSLTDVLQTLRDI